MQKASLKPELDRLYEAFNREDAAADPVQFVHRYREVADREIVAFAASALAFGRVASVLASVERLLALMGSSPARFVRTFVPREVMDAFAGLGHRWTRGEDLVALLLVLRHMVDCAGSLERYVADDHDPEARDITDAVERFSARACAVDVREVYGKSVPRQGVRFFFPRPSSGSACKRLNLFLRWMVRSDAVDPGGWTMIRPAQLVVPLDTHVIRVGRCLGLTRYRSPGWRMAVDITASLRRLDPRDPVRYDFSLCHLGMMGACGFGTNRSNQRCPLRAFCRPRDGVTA
ncbi:MAG: TIGR02757 family protein [Luteitalea sp.]|nr:TIGR02757 family protein [Luteitalea sp.]